MSLSSSRNGRVCMYKCNESDIIVPISCSECGSNWPRNPPSLIYSWNMRELSTWINISAIYISDWQQRGKKQTAALFRIVSTGTYVRYVHFGRLSLSLSLSQVVVLAIEVVVFRFILFLCPSFIFFFFFRGNVNTAGWLAGYPQPNVTRNYSH